jgi:uncharacterized protein (TIGR04255 family)
VCNVDFDFVKRQPVLARSPLKIVICQMRYPRQIGVGEADLRPVQRALATAYPTARLGRTAELVVTPAGVTPAGEPDPVFQFVSADEGWTVMVGPDSISLETTAYVDFADFRTRWYVIVSAVTEAFDLARQERIGLRYLNEIACQTPLVAEELRRVVRPELVGPLGAMPRTEKLIGSSNELRFSQDRGVCTMRHGLVQRTDGSVYVLDMDFYDDVGADLDVEQQMRLLADFAHGAFEVFRWAIDPAHFATFEPKEPVGA